MIHYDDEIIFNKLIAKDPNPGEKNRLKKSEDGNFIIVPGWVVDQKEEYIVSTHGTKKFYREFKLNSQVLYDILILGFTNIDQRPLCPVCGNPINFRNNLFGKYAGYYNTTCGNPNCHYQLVKDKLLSEDAMKRSVATRMKNGGYDHMFGNTYRKDNPISEEAKECWRKKMKGKKRNPESVKKGAMTRAKYYKEHPDKLQKFINSSKGKNKKGTIEINKSKTKKFFYLSSWEMKLVLFLDKELDDVLQIEAPLPIEYVFNDTEHNYFADIDITLSNGKKLLIEIKPSSHLYHKKNQAKFSAGRLFVENEDNYLDYLIITEHILFENPRKQDNINKSKIKDLILSYIDN